MSGTAPRSGFVIVGASLAGLRGAEALRRNGYHGPLTIIGDEPYAPYDRPPLSKHVLSGELPPDATTLPALRSLDARWILGRAAVSLDARARSVGLADGATVAFDKLLIATGAQARPWPNATEARLGGVFTMRGRDDAEAIRKALAGSPRRVLIVGGGLIGCEAASCCRDLGLPVTLVDPNPTPMARSLGAVVGQIIVERMKAAGVDFRPNTKVRALAGDAAGRVTAAVLHDGGEVSADLVIVALGAVRNLGWLAGAGLQADEGGLTCDAACRALLQDGRPSPDIYAAGDVARWPNSIYGGRLVSVEHWGNAVDQAAHAAENMVAAQGDQRDYVHLPAFWSSQFGINIKAVGIADGADALAIVHGTRASHRFLAVYGKAGRTIAAVAFDQARWLPAYGERVAAGAPFPPILDACDQPVIERLAPGFPPPRERASSKGAANV